jgi:NCAIR mutase (PurE)-related protein
MTSVELLEKKLLDFKNGRISLRAILKFLKNLPYENLGFARLDHHRHLRKGFSEVIFCQGKTIPQIKKIFARLATFNKNFMATRAEANVFKEIRRNFPKSRYFPQARIITAGSLPKPKNKNPILVISAGTSDIPAAEEAAVTAEFLQNKVERLYDVGVAGIHRLLEHRPLLEGAPVIIVAAGMEGALASVVASLVDCPVIGLPTSIGYGVSTGGISALMTMLASCVPGIAVVNIDNGFGAGCLASLINSRKEK